MELGVSPTSISIIKKTKSRSLPWRNGSEPGSYLITEVHLIAKFHTICPSIPARRLNSGVSTKSQAITWIIVITGNNRLKEHMFRIGLTETCFCEWEEVQTAAHPHGLPNNHPEHIAIWNMASLQTESGITTDSYCDVIDSIVMSYTVLNQLIMVYHRGSFWVHSYFLYTQMIL